MSVSTTLPTNHQLLPGDQTNLESPGPMTALSDSMVGSHDPSGVYLTAPVLHYWTMLARLELIREYRL